jgi:hypothetical protein
MLMVPSGNSRLREVALLLCAGACSLLSAPPAPETLPAPPPLPPNLRVPPPPPENLPDAEQLQKQFRQLAELLSMEPEQLNRLRETLEVIQNMSPDQREAMRIRLRQVTQATPELRNEIRLFSNRFPTLNPFDLTQYWYAASEEERSSVRTQLGNLESKQQLELMSSKILAFIERRDAVFKSMRESLGKKRQSKATKAEPEG